MSDSQALVAEFEALVQQFGRLPAYLTGNPIDSRGYQLIVVTCVFGPIAIFTTILRFYVRLRIVRSVGWDDYTILAGNIFTVTFCAVYLWAVKDGGLGRYIIDVP